MNDYKIGKAKDLRIHMLVYQSSLFRIPENIVSNFVLILIKRNYR